jgi:hypothetical protein
VLDDVERRRLLVEPARKDPLPAPLGIAHVELDEGAGQRLHLPRRASLAGAQANDRIADAHRLARPERDRTGDAIALVEKAEHRHPLRHGGRPGRHRGHGLRDVDRARLSDGLAVDAGFLLGVPVAAGERGESEENGAGREPHA